MSTKKTTKSQRKRTKKAAASKPKAPKPKASAAKAETTKPAASTKSVKAKKPAGEPKPKRVSALDAAAQILRKTGKPMRAQDLITAMTEQGLWTSPNGKTPHATLYAAMQREERDKRNASRFKKVDRGLFAFNG